MEMMVMKALQENSSVELNTTLAIWLRSTRRTGVGGDVCQLHRWLMCEEVCNVADTTRSAMVQVLRDTYLGSYY
jgi:hypothetical protein